MKQCPSCNRVWVPNAAHADGGVWEKETQRVAGAERDYCAQCLAKRQAQVQTLSHDIEEVAERRHAGTAAATSALEVAAPVAWRRPVLVAAAIVVLVAGAVAVRALFKPVTAEMSSGPGGEGGDGSGLGPAVGGSWSAGGTRTGPLTGRGTVQPGQGRRGQPSEAGRGPWSFFGGPSRDDTSNSRASTEPGRPSDERREAGESRESGSRGGESRGGFDFTSGSEAGGSSPEEGQPAEPGAQGGEQPGTEEQPPEEEPPPIVLPPGVEPPGELPPEFTEPPREIVIPIPPPDER